MGFLSNIFGSKKETGTKGYALWEFGMTPEQVSQGGFGPYRSVPETGGLMIQGGPFGGKTAPISFIFNPYGLHRIQIWVYEGNDPSQAAEAFYKVYDHMKFHGALECNGVSIDQFAEPDKVKQTLVSMMQMPNPDGVVRKIQMKALDIKPEDVNVFSSLVDSPQGKFVFLYYSKK